MQLSRLLIAVAPLLHSATSIMNSSAFTARPSVANKVYTDHLLFHSAVRSRLNCLVMCAFTLGCVRVTHTGERGDSGTCRGHSTQLFPSEQGTSTPGAVTFVWTGLRRVSGKGGVCWCLLVFVDCLTSQQHASVSQGRICSDKCTCCHTETRVAIKLSTSPSHSILTPGQPVPALTLQCRAPGRVATGMPFFLVTGMTPY